MRHRSSSDTMTLSRRSYPGPSTVTPFSSSVTFISRRTRLDEALAKLVGEARYDVSVLTGDYRGGTNGRYDTTLAGMARLCDALKGPVYGVLGITTRFVWCRDWRRWE